MSEDKGVPIETYLAYLEALQYCAYCKLPKFYSDDKCQKCGAPERRELDP